ncbi:MAG: response regulator [Candidatus Delongbacteria bacterium]|nr:response regulator [Candidatus Delongbacteria bacterium]
MSQNKDKRMSEAIKLAKIGFFSYMFDGTILEIDQAAFDFFELEGIFKDPGSVTGENIGSLFDYKGEVGRLRRIIKDKKKVFNLEYSIRTLKGTDKWGIHNSYIFIDEATGKEAIQVCFYDITSMKKKEEEKRILENRLHQAEKLQSIGQLAGGVAHDFNNQLTGIIGYADLLRYALKDNRELAHYVDNILIASKRSSDLTNQLLAFARKGKYLSVEIDVHRIIMEVISLLQHSIDKRISLQQVFKANPPVINGDPTQIQNALLNLALNARDAMPNGGSLVFETNIVELNEGYCNKKIEKIQPGKYIEISITDTGTGMTNETQNRVFEPFFTTKDVGKGTGMGLPAVYGTVKNHNGSIDVISEIGKGTTVKIYLPISSSVSDIETKDDIEDVVLNKKLRILLVDDEDMVLNIGKEMLELYGHSISICKDGIEAVELYKKNWKDIDLVILDMVMPRLSGNETFYAMKEINPELNVLLSSGYSISGEAQKLLAQGAKGFIQKPFTLSELTRSIAEIFPHESIGQLSE